nr:hypothetical protein [Nostoc sp. LEGE 12450]
MIPKAPKPKIPIREAGSGTAWVTTSNLKLGPILPLPAVRVEGKLKPWDEPFLALPVRVISGAVFTNPGTV